MSKDGNDLKLPLKSIKSHRTFHIDVGSLPKTEAERYLRAMMMIYRIKYNEFK